ncbi:putative mitochondrial PGP phosphatase [Lyophyllum shimeji]|uniref:Mitochondrial PGP phosphatase n=1 Tax=Lyophyllum shimeji TaxID=47721 RepID=A0A9P3PK10_LYOSH|nr:putative mitochondrial PGP phosphatase [Lyophyllum shimeji]
MPLNIPGLLISSLKQDIRRLDFAALQKAGYRGAVFDKDNCLTRPDRDTVVPEIEEAWLECQKVFGMGNVLIVSNSAGTWMDPGGIQCESVAANARVPVLRHKALKPAYSCITAIRDYFSSLRVPIHDEELIIVGDRIFTDVVMANRMRDSNRSPRLSEYEDGGAVGKEKDAARNGPRGPLAVWTTDVWEKDATIMRWSEKKLVNAVRRWTRDKEPELDTTRFVKQLIQPQPARTGTIGMMAGLLGRLRG